MSAVSCSRPAFTVRWTVRQIIVSPRIYILVFNHEVKNRVIRPSKPPSAPASYLTRSPDHPISRFFITHPSHPIYSPPSTMQMASLYAMCSCCRTRSESDRPSSVGQNWN